MRTEGSQIAIAGEQDAVTSLAQSPDALSAVAQDTKGRVKTDNPAKEYRYETTFKDGFFANRQSVSTADAEILTCKINQDDGGSLEPISEKEYLYIISTDEAMEGFMSNIRDDDGKGQQLPDQDNFVGHNDP